MKKKLPRILRAANMRRLMSNRRFQLVSIIVIALIGVSLLTISRAATTFVAIEPEDGTATDCAKPVSDANLSGGGAIKFGCETTGSSLVLISPKSEISQLKQAVKSGNKKTYWEYVQGRPATRVNSASIPNWSTNMTYTLNGVAYTFNPTRMVSTEHASSKSVDAQGTVMLGAAQNAYGCALEWALADDQACGEHAVNIIDSWSSNFTYAYCRPSGIDARENQVKLWSEWSVPQFTKAMELLWDHPSFTQTKKDKAADWLWKVFMLENANLQESDGEILGHRAVGWNGRMASLGARLNIGLVMKATGHTQANSVVEDIRAKIDSILPEVLYYGKAPWHETLGQPYPNQPYRSVNTTYGGWHTVGSLKNYWFLSTNSSTPPPFFVGQTQETGRDIGHTMMGIGSLTEVLRALRLNGYGDRFASSDLGAILSQMGERHARVYNEALDKYWAGGYSTVNDLSCVWQPSEWNSLQLSAGNDCPAGNGAVSFKVGGSSSDHGWEFLRTEVKRAGYATPNMDKLVGRLRGTGTRSTTKVAGFGTIDTANHMAWGPLFAPDYN